ncbi:MAG: hypothetical protein ACK5C0_12285 [Candidatus Kapaibacterium sp.]|jgi:hypothetical protein
MTYNDICSIDTETNSVNINPTILHRDQSLQDDTSKLDSGVCIIREKVLFLASVEYFCNKRGQVVSNTLHDYISTQNQETCHSNNVKLEHGVLDFCPD